MAADRESAMPDVMAIDFAEALWLARHMPGALQQATNDGPNRTILAPSRQPDTQVRPAPSDHGLQPSPPTRHSVPKALPPQTGGPAAPNGAAYASLAVGAPSISTPHRSRELSRLLKPLRVTVGSPTLTVLDEELTAERAAAFGVWMPVAHPAPERAFDVVLMVDNHPTMAPWRRTVDELRQVLYSLGAFRNIREIPLDVAATQAVPVDLVRVVQRTNSHQLVLLLTDGLADAWRDGQLVGPLHALANSQLLSIIHMMNDSAWSASHLQGQRTQLRHSGAVPHSNAQWTAENGSRLNGQVPTQGITVPVITLEERFLRAWVAFITGKDPHASLPTLTLLPSRGPFPAAAPTPPAVSASSSVAVEDPAALEGRLTAHLPPDELKAARILAAVPLTDVNMRAALAEVAPALESFLPSVLSGLLAVGALLPVGVAPNASREAAQVATETVDFVPGLRARLLAHAPTSETARAMSAAHRYLATDDVWGHFDRAALADPAAAHPAVTADTLRRAGMSATVFTALSGRHRSLGRRLAQATQAVHTSTTAQPPASDPRADIDLPAQRSRPTRLTKRTRWGSSVPPRNRHFTGRHAHLARLREMLTRQSFTEVAVVGMAGVGKTHLVTEYIYRYGDDYDLVWWIPPELSHRGALPEAYRMLADRLACDGVALSSHDPVVASLEALRCGAAARRWLLVVDGAPNVASVRSLLPVGGPGSVIVTSRDPRWELEQDALRLEVFERSESTALLIARNPRLTGEQAGDLAKDLGDLPQAVEDASRMLAETGMPVDNYLRPAPASLLAAATRAGADSPGSTGAWSVALDQLRDQDPSAYALLQVYAWLGDAPVSRALLPGVSQLPRQPDFSQLHPLTGDPLGPYLAIRELNRAALVQLNERDGTLTLHRLVRQAVMAEMDDDARRVSRRAAHLLLAARIPGEGTSDQEYLRLAPHFAASGMVESQEPLVQRAVVAMVQCLARQGDYAAARSLGDAAVAAWPSENRSTSWTLRRDPLGELRKELRRLPKTGPLPRQQRPPEGEET
ncbi:FxSxx-COOH system tetratricopeptide repeat protein [Streptomyces sp. NPDC002491]